MNFEYSPGLKGYGAVGADGSVGMQGMALYFTDYDTQSNFIDIEYAIENNYVLWSSAPPATKLPGGRVYQTGDLLVDNRGLVWKIDASIDEIDPTNMKFNKTGLFTNLPYNLQTYNNFYRYFNICDGSTKYIIDNNFSTKSNYLISSNVYGIEPKNFNRIEYTDSSTGAFTMYSTARDSGIDDSQAIAIVMDSSGFHIGNINNGIARNTNLTLDVNRLIYKKEPSNRIKNNSESGIVLTNSEKNIPLLYDPNFVPAPGYFQTYIPGSDDITIYWNLADFTSGVSDASIKGDLYFYKDVSTYPLVRTMYDSSEGKPLVFHNVGQTGNVTINGLGIGTVCEYFMLLYKDGWERASSRITAITGASPYIIKVIKPASKTMTVDYLGNFTGDSSVDVSTFVFSTWNASSNVGWMSFVPPTPNGSTGNYTFDVSIQKNVDSTSRIGNIALRGLSVPNENIIVTQNPLQIEVSFDSNGKIVYSNPLTDQTISMTIQLGTWGVAAGRVGGRREVSIKNETWVKNAGVWSVKPNFSYAHAESENSGADPNFSPSQSGWVTATNTFNVNSTNDVSIYIFSSWQEGTFLHSGIVGPSCDTEWSNPWWGAGYWLYVESMGYAYISNVTKVSGTGNVTFGTNRYYYWKKVFTNSTMNCISTRTASSTIPSHPGYYPQL